MRQTQLFTKTRKEAPADEVAKNAQLLIRAGYVHKEMAGVYAFLPLGLRTLNKIIQIIREEMNTIGGQEVTLTALQNPEVWNKSGRFADDVIDVWFKTKLKNDTELGLGTTHEEPLTALMTEHISSYRDLPCSVYQFQTKFRNETRAKSGIMRGREFLMKDLYSFCLDEKQHNEFYEKAKQAYVNVFNRVGLGEKTYLTFASGGSFSKYSHEFQTVCDAGEDTIYIDKEKGIAINEEVNNDEVLTNLDLNKDNLVKEKSIEVGNIFTLGTKFSDALDLEYLNEQGEKQKVFMGSYGIGPSRVMGTIVELLADDKGIVWSESVAPFKVHLVSVGSDKPEVSKAADDLYEKLNNAGVEVLYDDRDLRPGEKFADSDLLGMPWRVVISEKTLAENILEVKNRATGDVQKLTEAEFLQLVQS